MPEHLPLHEKRERWVTAISVSFQSITVFRFARTRALEVNDLIVDIQEELTDMDKRLAIYIPKNRLISFWEGTCHILRALDAGYFDILTRIGNLEWIWWRNKDEDTRAQFRTRKCSMIKRLAVYDWLLSLLQNAFKASFHDSRPWFLDTFDQYETSSMPQRRASFQGFTHQMSEDVHERAVTELSILRWTTNLEELLRDSIHDMQEQYNQGKVYEHYVNHLQWTAEKEKLEWKQDNLKWPYPDHLLQLTALDDEESEVYKRHKPLEGVPCWQDDEELEAFIAYLAETRNEPETYRLAVGE